MNRARILPTESSQHSAEIERMRIAERLQRANAAPVGELPRALRRPPPVEVAR